MANSGRPGSGSIWLRESQSCGKRLIVIVSGMRFSSNVPAGVTAFEAWKAIVTMIDRASFEERQRIDRGGPIA